LEQLVAEHLRSTGGKTGGTLGNTDEETRVRTGNLRWCAQPERGAPSGVSSNGCVENRELGLAPQVGLEPTTLRLTAQIWRITAMIPSDLCCS